MSGEFFLLLGIGFCAQLIDGALGMAYGILSNAAMLVIGIAPAQASALVHTAEIFTTGASAASHIHHRNVDWQLVARLGLAGVIGAILGAWVLSNVDVAAARRFVYVYLLLMGVYILLKSLRLAPVRPRPAAWTVPLAGVGGFLDASGGGGWGPIVTSTLIGSGHAPRHTIGSVNVTEFFVAAAAAGTFVVELGSVSWHHLVPLVLGGLCAAPFGGWAVKRIPARGLMTAVGGLIVALSLFQLARVFGLI